MAKQSLPPVKCKGCNVRFVPKTRKQKYHSDTCRIEYYEKHYFAKKEVEKTCPNCDIKCLTSKPLLQVYCTPECRIDAQKKRAEGVLASHQAERVTYLADRHAAMKRDGFRCRECGRGPQDGAALDVELDGGELKTICTDCKRGKEEHE